MADAAIIENGNSVVTTTTTADTILQPQVIQLHQTSSTSSRTSSLRNLPPSSSDISNDTGLTLRLSKPAPASVDEQDDLFKLVPTEALKLLSANVELLVRMTGDVPPTPPPKMLTNPQMSDMQAEKENIVRSHSQKNLAQLRQQASREDMMKRSGSITGKRPANDDHMSGKTKLQAYSAVTSTQLPSESPAVEPIDGVRLRPEATARRSPPPSPYIIVGEDSQPINTQHGAITRKFYSKNEPPISINQYLTRLHQFCPMSAAVYLATSLYIHRLAVEERAIPVTRRNAHRLVLAGLRVAMKALEDLSYPHTKFAKVGGVSETELARLEISFCFLTGFELVVGEEILRQHWETLKGGKVQNMLEGLESPTLNLENEKVQEAYTQV